MTVSAAPRKAGPYIGTGTTNVFAFAFKTTSPDLLRVVEADALGGETDLAYGAGYTVALNGNQDTSPGGTVTRVAGNLPVNYRLTILSNVPYSQQTDIPSGGVLSEVTVENALDVLAIQVQQLAERSLRAVEVPPTSGLSVPALLGQIVTSGDTAAQANATANGALATAAQANAVATAALATVADIATKSYVDGVIPAGTKMVFHQAAAPAGWTQDISKNDRVLRVVSGAGGGTGGAWNITGLSSAAYTLTINDIPAHGHPYQHKPASEGSTGSGATGGLVTGLGSGTHTDAAYSGAPTTSEGQVIGGTGGGGAHAHGISQDGSWRPAYADVIVCSKN